MKSKDLRDLTKEELLAKQLSLKEDLMNMRLQVKMGKLEKPSMIRQARKDVARILTVLNEESYAKANTSQKKA